MIANLIDNGIRHNERHGYLTVATGGGRGIGAAERCATADP